MKRRRTLVLGSLLALAGCGLSERPYAEQRQWPLTVTRPLALPPRPRGRTLLVRSIQAAPGLGARGLQMLLPDGSLRVDFYEQWAVPPAEGVESDLRQWLAESGLFAAVVAPGSRAAADLSLEGTLTALIAEPARGVARAALTLVLVDPRPSPDRILLQQRFTAERPLPDAAPPTVVRVLLAAVADLLGQVEAALARFA
jgi:ABC-type uncharacterized transport system auxiliary subunit